MDDVERIWRRTIWLFRFFPLWIALIMGFNIWDDHSQGKAFNWILVWAGLGFLAFTGVFYMFSRLMHKFVRRYARHRDNQSP